MDSTSLGLFTSNLIKSSEDKSSKSSEKVLTSSLF